MDNNIPDSKLVEIPQDMVETETPTSNQGELGAPETPEPEKVEQSKDLQSALAQKEHWRKKAEEAEAKLRSATPQVSTSNTSDPMETVKISKILSKYNDEESEFILERAGKVSFDAIKRAEEDKWTQTAINAMREKVAKENKIPAPGSSSPFGTTEKSPQEIQNMSREEHMKLEAKVVKERLGGRGI